MNANMKAIAPASVTECKMHFVILLELRTMYFLTLALPENAFLVHSIYLT